MSKFILNRRGFLQAGMAGALFLAGAGGLLQPPRRASAARLYALTVQGGNKSMVDGRSIPVWGYAMDGVLQVPAAPLLALEGESVTVQLTNQRSEPHNFYIPGVVPEVSVAPGASYTYTFTAPAAGTYFFYDSLSPVHRSMGLYGALAVAPANGGNQLWSGGPSFGRQFVWVASSLDETWNTAAAAGQAVDTSNYRPNYFLLNGKGGSQPDTGTWTSTEVRGTVGETVLIRRVNASLVPHSLHYHGFHFQEVARNNAHLANPRLKDTSLIYPGDTSDILFTFDQTGQYVVHDHILMGNTGNGVYPNGMMGMLNIA